MHLVPPVPDCVPPDTIAVENRARALNEAAVGRLMESIQRLGLQTPLSVRRVPNSDHEYSLILIAGYHRLEACKRLGMAALPVVVHSGTAVEARLWELSENWHRTDLDTLERAAHVAEWLRLTNETLEAVSVQVEHKPTGGRPEGGVAKVARELGISRSQATRALSVNNLTDQAKQAARDTGLANNQKALLAAAGEPAEKQADAIRSYKWSKTAPAEPAYAQEDSWAAEVEALWHAGKRDWQDRMAETLGYVSHYRAKPRRPVISDDYMKVFTPIPSAL